MGPVTMLHVDVYGEGRDIVLLHGWGMHGGLFRGLAQQLATAFRVTVVDLPGHGKSCYAQQREIAQWASAVLEAAPPQACWIGWSLGGLVALAAVSAAPQRCRGLVLLASTPKFVASADWPNAVDKGVFDQFAQQLEADAERTLGRFLALQTRGSENSSDTLRRVRTELVSRPQAAPEALRAGLGLLLSADFRGVLSNCNIPLFGLFGERDTLVPAQVANDLPGLRSAVIAGAGHAPFISHARQCSEQVKRWLVEDTERRHAAN